MPLHHLSQFLLILALGIWHLAFGIPKIAIYLYIKYTKKSTQIMRIFYIIQILSILFVYCNELLLKLGIQIRRIKAKVSRQREHSLPPCAVVFRQVPARIFIVPALHALQNGKVLLSKSIAVLSTVFHAKDRSSGHLFVDLLRKGK